MLATEIAWSIELFHRYRGSLESNLLSVSNVELYNLSLLVFSLAKPLTMFVGYEVCDFKCHDCQLICCMTSTHTHTHVRNKSPCTSLLDKKLWQLVKYVC